MLAASTSSAIANMPGQQPLFASACKFSDGTFGALLMDQTGHLLSSVVLPARGHDVVFDRHKARAVCFARRPGNFAVAFATDGREDSHFFTSAAGRHFYGHGAFSPDGKLLFASENDTSTGTDTGAGKIGIYDATNNFRRLGEYESHGVGPHQILMMPNRPLLAVCNGGIRTHPSTGRAKLNLDSMEPSLVFIDTRDGGLVDKHRLADDYRQLSIRHMAIKDESNIIFGCQYQGSKDNLPPLLGNCQLGDRIELWSMADETLAKFNHYTGSVAISKNGEQVAVSSPKGGVVAVLSTLDHKVIRHYPMNKACGLAPADSGFLASTLRGEIGFLRSGAITNPIKAFDNHIGWLRVEL